MKNINLKEHIDKSIDNALKHISNIDNDDILSINGMSSERNRHLLNNLLNINDVNYLEIGVHKGSTFVSALYKNNINSSYAIDNWSEFNNGDIKSEFLKNCNNFNINNFKFIENDSFKLDLNDIKNKINIYFYDGNHTTESTIKSLEYYYDILDDEFIFIVDDYDWDYVQKGVKIGIENCKLNIIYEKYLKSDFCGDKNTWWNGLYIVILKK